MPAEYFDIRGETAHAITRMFNLPGEAMGGGHHVTFVRETDKLSIQATTTQGFAQLSIVPSRNMITYAVTDIENGTIDTQRLDDSDPDSCFSMCTQDWSPSGVEGKRKAIIPRHPDDCAKKLILLTRQTMSRVKAEMGIK